MCYALYLFNGDNYYKATLSNAEWHLNAGEYGTNYPENFQKYGDLVAEDRRKASQEVDETELFWSMSADERKSVDEYLKSYQKLPEGYSLKTRITEGKIVPSPININEDEVSRENVEVQGAKTYVVREGFKAPDSVWNEETDIATAFTNKFDLFPNTFKPNEDKNGNGILDPGEDIYSISEETGAIDYSKGNGVLDGPDQDRGALEGAIWAIVPLCLILLFVLMVGLRQKPKHLDELGIGIACAVIGMCLFNLGISLGLTPLGEQLGGNVVSSFASIQPWQSEGFIDPLFSSSTAGKCLAILFGFILGYGATLAEPALNALGSTVEKITVGAFKKNLLMQAVATGVALGIATGVAKIAFNLELWYLLIPPYALLLILTFLSSEDFVNFGWDSAGVTTGPITVPLVLAMGLGIGAKTGAIDGFGVLSLASVGPIITVLTVGLIVRKKPKNEEELNESMEAV
jgi:hypothetical protein